MKRYRKKSLKHRVLESYYYRSELTAADLQRLENLHKGHVGELAWDEKIYVLPSDYLIVNDLMLPYSDSHFQIDALVAVGDTLNHYEIKNYVGTYVKKEEVLVSETGYEIAEPVSQISKAHAMLNNTMRRLGYRFKIRSYVIFVNPEFHWANAVKSDSVFFTHQLPRHIRGLLARSCQPSARMEQFLKALMAMDDLDYCPPKMPFYEKVRFGIKCPHCHTFESSRTQQYWLCGGCKFRQPIVDAIARTAVEFHEMKPAVLITTDNVYDWCGGEFDKQQIRRALKKYFVSNGNTSGTHYTRKRVRSS